MPAKMTDGALAIELASTEAVKSFFAEAVKTLGFYLQLEAQLEFFQRLEIEISAPGIKFAFAGEVVQVHPVSGGFGTAFQLVDWDAKKEKELEKKLRGEKQELADSELSPVFKIKKMNPSERFRLAMKASRVERQILLRDNSPQVLLGLLRHPQIENKEVIEVVKSSFATGAIMEQVASNRKWMAHPDLPVLIAKGPKTPQPLAMKLLTMLRTADLQVMAKSSALREPLRKAALKVYLKRIGSK